MKHIPTKYPRIITLKSRDGLRVEKVNKPELLIITLLGIDRESYSIDNKYRQEDVARHYYPDLIRECPNCEYIDFNYEEIHKRILRLLRGLVKLGIVIKEKSIGVTYHRGGYVLTPKGLALYMDR